MLRPAATRVCCPEFAEEVRISACAHDADDGFAINEHDQGGNGYHLVLLNIGGLASTPTIARRFFSGDLLEHWRGESKLPASRELRRQRRIPRFGYPELGEQMTRDAALRDDDC
jgi:hypothetical protein